MNIFFKSIVSKACLNIMFMDYIYNVNTQKNLDLLKNEIVMSIDKYKNEKTNFKFNLFKVLICRENSRYKYMYPKYSNHFEDFILISEIQNNDTFVQELKKKIKNCDDLFVLYLSFKTIEDKLKN